MTPPAFLIAERADVYHARATAFLSSHLLADFRKCPELYHRKQLGLILDSDSPAYALGRAAHTLILEGRAAFETEYAVGGPVNPKTGLPFGRATKAFQEWADVQEKAFLSDEDAAFVERLAAAVQSHPVAPLLLAGGVAEGVCRAEYAGVPCQARPDYFHPEQGIVDLKTCDDLTWFEADARRYGYLHQVAFYRAVLRVPPGCTWPVHIVAVEKKEPFRVGVWRLAESALDLAEADNEDAFGRLMACRATGIWPTGFEMVRLPGNTAPVSSCGPVCAAPDVGRTVSRCVSRGCPCPPA